MGEVGGGLEDDGVGQLNGPCAACWQQRGITLRGEFGGCTEDVAQRKGGLLAYRVEGTKSHRGWLSPAGL